MDSTALVWFKRDLRLADHAPLAEAARFPRAAAVFIVEPSWLASAEFDPAHLAFALGCVDELRQTLAQRGLPLLIEHGEAVAVLRRLHQTLGFRDLLSHEETGAAWSWARDRAVARWCAQHDVRWREWPQTGVVRRLGSRDGWARRWHQRMSAVRLPPPQRFSPAMSINPAPTATPATFGLAPEHRATPVPGERAAQQTLQEFLDHRGRGYRRGLSSPVTAPHCCSRLSTHLSFGTLSMREVYQATAGRIASLGRSAAAPDRALAQDLRAFAGRLRWHCHFMQKLEDEPAIEWRNLATIYDGLRPGDDRGAALNAARSAVQEARGHDPVFGQDAALLLDDEARQRYRAWCEGRTGYPMVDACMRYLRAGGWLNFRMRAMLVSFAAYHLWLHWRAPGQFLARQFLDFEPGIHWSQMQMQSGTTGINTLRMYSPSKQARDHDPAGVFVRQWLPEFGTAAYPAPIVDEKAALVHAQQRLYGLRRRDEAREEADRIQARHGSRRSGLPPSGMRRKARKPPADTGQGRLFD
ncbi:MAG: deoxyribodipyrimidine photolyase [Nevskiaceae bacterium]|nr:MAG: deoxyribodipyrimidine photolyase [Nevskiaceae bacterium]